MKFSLFYIIKRKGFLLLNFLSFFIFIISNECKNIKLKKIKSNDLLKDLIDCECIKFKTFSQFVSLYKKTQEHFLSFLKFIFKKIDHFRADSNSTFQQRYIISDKYLPQNRNNSPILFYPGNEFDISWFCKNSVLLIIFSVSKIIRK